MKTRVIICVIWIVLGAGVSADEGAKVVGKFVGKVSKLEIPAAQLGSEWTGPTGMVVDNFNDLSEFSDDDKPIVEEVKKQVTSIGGVQTADFAYRKKFNPLHQVTLRVFVFESEQSCRNWWKQKYQFEGWEKLYSPVAGVPYDAVDSKEGSKRAVAFGNVWMTCSVLSKSEDHLKVLDLYISKLKGELK